MIRSAYIKPKNVFCHHYTTQLAIFRTKNPPFQVLFSHSANYKNA